MDSDTPLFSGSYRWRQSDAFEPARVTYRRKLAPKLMNGLVGLIFGGLFLLMIFSSRTPAYLKLVGMVAMVPIVAASLSDRFWPLLGFGLLSSAEPVVLTVTPAALKAGVGGEIHRSPWSGFASVAETPDSFVLYADKKHFMVVPKRAFAPAQLAPLKAFLRERFGAAAELMEG